MQPWVATLISAGVVILINLGTAAYVYGKLTQSVSSLADDVDRHETRLNAHGAALGDQGRKIATIEGRMQISGHD